MAFLTKPLTSIVHQGLYGLFRARKVLAALLAVGLGLLLAILINSSLETTQITISILVGMLILLLIIKNPLNGILIWVLFMAFLEQWVEIPMGVGLPDLSFSRFIIAFTAVFMLAQAAIGKLRFAPLSLTDVLIVATTIGVMISAPLDANPIRAMQRSISIHFTPLIIYFFAKNVVQSKADLKKVLLAVALFGFAAGTYAAYEFATGNVLFLPRDESVRLYRGDTGIRLIRGLMGETGAMGRVLAITIPVSFYLFLEEARTVFKKILLAIMLVVQFYGIIIAMSRTPWYALLIALFIMQFFYPQFRKLFIVIVLAAVVVVWATWDQVSQTAISERVNEKTEDLHGRTPRWEAAINMWEAKPIRGWGFGRYKEESGRFRTDGFTRNFTAIENDYLAILVGAGLIGLTPYVLFLAVPLINSLRLFFRARAPDWPGYIKPETVTVYWAVIACFLITSYTGVVTHPVIKLLPFAVTGAVVGSHEVLLRRSKTRRRAQIEPLAATDNAPGRAVKLRP